MPASPIYTPHSGYSTAFAGVTHCCCCTPLDTPQPIEVKVVQPPTEHETGGLPQLVPPVSIEYVVLQLPAVPCTKLKLEKKPSNASNRTNIREYLPALLYALKNP